MKKINARQMKVGETYRINGKWREVVEMDDKSFKSKPSIKPKNPMKVIFEKAK